MKFLHKIMAITMAFMVFFSTSAFAVSMHFCGENLVHYSFAGKADTCGMEQNKSTPSSCSIEKTDCCTNTNLIKAQDDFNANFDFSLQQQTFVTAFFYTYTQLFTNLPEQIVPFKDYAPPLLVYDYTVLDQEFII